MNGETMVEILDKKHQDRINDKSWILYFIAWNGEVKFAIDINKNVQLFTKEEAEIYSKDHMMIARVGF